MKFKTIDLQHHGEPILVAMFCYEKCTGVMAPSIVPKQALVKRSHHEI